MLLASRKDNIAQEGQRVVMYEGVDNLYPVVLKKGGLLQCRLGDFPHNDIIGMPFGYRVGPLSWGSARSSLPRAQAGARSSRRTRGAAHGRASPPQIRSSSRVGGWMTLLPLTAELWTRSLRTRTQIVFSTDAAFIAQQLELAPGCTVVESGACSWVLSPAHGRISRSPRGVAPHSGAGTGSGALSSTFARCVAPSGHVHTFEYNQDRVQAAGCAARHGGRLPSRPHAPVRACVAVPRSEDFKANGLEGVVTLRHANVYDDGFGAHLDNKAHAVFLDLPAPWQAVHHARRVLQLGGRVATFSPCIEQVQRTVQELRAGGFQGAPPSLNAPPLGPLWTASHSQGVPTARAGVLAADVRTFECLERRMMSRSMAVPVSELAALGQHVQGALSATKTLRKRRMRGARGTGSGGSAGEGVEQEAGAAPPHKRPRHPAGDAAEGGEGEGEVPSGGEPPSGEEGLAALIERRTSKQKPKDVMWRSRPGIVMRAHTSFLTFATLRDKQSRSSGGGEAAAGAAGPTEGAE